MERTVLVRAANVLDAQAQPIVGRWLERLPEATPSLPRGRCLADMADAAPQIVHGVAQALRLGRPEALDAPWTRPAREHAQIRTAQGELLIDLLREFQILREEIWTALMQHLRPVSEDDVYWLARNLGAAVDTMVTISSSTYGAELQRALAQAEAGREAASRLAAIVEHSDEAILSLDLQGTVRSWNPAAEQLYGYRAEEMIGRSLSALIPSDRADEPAGILARASKGEAIPVYDTVRLRKDGSQIEVSLTASPVKGAQGQVTGVSWVAHDISGRQRAEAEHERLRGEAEHRAAELDATISAISDGLIIYGAQGEVLRLNAAGERMLAVAEAEWAAVPPEERAHRLRAGTPEGRPLAAAELPSARALQGETVTGYRLVIHWPDGARRELLASAAPIRGARGQIDGAVVNSSDITPIVELQQERERLLAEVQRRKAELDAAMFSVPDGLVIYGPGAEIRHMNAAATELLGYSTTQRASTAS